MYRIIEHPPCFLLLAFGFSKVQVQRENVYDWGLYTIPYFGSF
jgi:hypothetical protein